MQYTLTALLLLLSLTIATLATPTPYWTADPNINAATGGALPDAGPPPCVLGINQDECNNINFANIIDERIGESQGDSYAHNDGNNGH